eukprot:s859_g15.t1
MTTASLISQVCAISLTVGLFVAIYVILRSRGLRVVLSASLFVAFLVATQLSVKIVESKPFNWRYPGLLTTLHFSCVVVAVSVYWTWRGEPRKIFPWSIPLLRWVKTVVPVAISQPISVVFNNKAMVYAGAGVCAVIGTLSPVCTAVISSCCGRRLTVLSWGGVIIAFFGALVISWGEVSSGTATSDAGSTSALQRERDPPPAFDGKNPDELRRYLRDLKLWRWETDTPKVKHAVKMLRQLTGPARAAADELSVETLMTEETYGAIMDEGDSDIEQHVYLADGDLDQIFDEDDVHAALATYQQVRKAIRDQKTARGFKSGKSFGKGYGTKVNNYGGKLQFGQTGTKVHIESLKLRTRCARCGMVGHWAKECSNQPDDYAKRRQESNSAPSAASSSAKMSSSMSGKSGFVHLGSDGASMMCISSCTTSFLPWDPISLSCTCPTSSSMSPTSSSLCMHVPCSSNFLGKDGLNGDAVQFCGVTTHGAFGLVDTAAQSGLIGMGALHRLNESLREHGLKVRWTNKVGNARGVGGEAKCQGVVEIPMGVGGVCGVLEATVVQEDVPLLLPVRMNQQKDAEMTAPADASGEVRNPRALLSWRKVASKIRELIQMFDSREPSGLAVLPDGGYSYGWLPPHSSQEPMVPPLPSFQGPSTTQEMRALQIQSGVRLPPRKSQIPPKMSAAVCTHPAKSLIGAGNQHQKEVWCGDCHARWKVETTVRTPGPAPKSAPRTPVQTTPTSLRMSLESPTLSPPTSSMGTAATPNVKMAIRCKCNVPAERMTVKKEGPTKGRHFFKCHSRVCDFFQWDPEEIRQLQEVMASKSAKREPEVSPEVCKLKEALEMERKKVADEKAALLMNQQLAEQSNQERLQEMMAQANQRHQELLEENTKHNETLLLESNQQHERLMEVSNMAYKSHVDQLQHQVCWLTTLVGEERIQEVMSNPQKYAEASIQAQQLKAEMHAAQGGQQ